MKLKKKCGLIWYKNQVSNDKIEKKNNSINDSRPNILQSKEWGSNLT